jgi:hypothetical protein
MSPSELGLMIKIDLAFRFQTLGFKTQTSAFQQAFARQGEVLYPHGSSFIFQGQGAPLAALANQL